MTTREEKEAAVLESVVSLLRDVTPVTVFDAIFESWRATRMGDGIHFDDVKEAIREAFERNKRIVAVREHKKCIKRDGTVSWRGVRIIGDDDGGSRKIAPGYIVNAGLTLYLGRIAMDPSVGRTRTRGRHPEWI